MGEVGVLGIGGVGCQVPAVAEGSRWEADLVEARSWRPAEMLPCNALLQGALPALPATAVVLPTDVVQAVLPDVLPVLRCRLLPLKGRLRSLGQARRMDDDRLLSEKELPRAGCFLPAVVLLAMLAPLVVLLLLASLTAQGGTGPCCEGCTVVEVVAELAQRVVGRVGWWVTGTSDTW